MQVICSFTSLLPDLADIVIHYLVYPKDSVVVHRQHGSQRHSGYRDRFFQVLKHEFKQGLVNVVVKRKSHRDDPHVASSGGWISVITLCEGFASTKKRFFSTEDVKPFDMFTEYTKKLSPDEEDRI